MLDILKDKKAEIIAAAFLAVVVLWLYKRGDVSTPADDGQTASAAPIFTAGGANIPELNAQNFVLPGYGESTSALVASLASALDSASSVTAAISTASDPGSASMFPLFGMAISGESAPYQREGVPAQTVQSSPAYSPVMTSAPRVAAAPPQSNNQPSFTTVIDPWYGAKMQVPTGQAVQTQNFFNDRYLSAVRSTNYTTAGVIGAR